jgi:hypothetical protein
LGGAVEVVAFSGSVVEFGGDFVEVSSRVFGKVCSLREVLPEKTIGVLVAAALPWRVWIAEVVLEGVDAYGQVGSLPADRVDHRGGLCEMGTKRAQDNPLRSR